MKRISYTLTSSDLEACLLALTKLDLVHDDTGDVPEEQILINKSCALSASAKLSAGKQLDANEMRVLCCCISFCTLVCERAISVDAATYNECMRYFFTFLKLDRELASQVMELGDYL